MAEDLRKIWALNRHAPETFEACVHDLFTTRARQQPDAQAVCAWDGELTYGELDEVSTRLARHLAGLGAGPGTIVPLCFEKSMWTSVAMLAVMKAGAASVALDTTQPAARLRTVVEQVFSHSKNQLIVSSVRNRALAGELVASINKEAPVVIAAEVAAQRQQNGTKPTPIASGVTPKDLLYVVFTSGSTGVPKGATVTHENFCSAVRLQQADLRIDRQSRVFDYVSYAFDVAWSNVLHTLTAGGCLCVPSDADRLDSASIAGSIQTLRANYAHITPTVGQLISAKDVPCLKTIAFIGEKLNRTVASSWATIDVLNTYGPAECTVTATIYSVPSSNTGDPSIGTGSGAVIWVVGPDGEELVPMGEIGELWIEGPIVGNGYLGDPVKTAAAFVEDPAWLLRGGPGSPGRRGRLYRTGDLVRFDEAEGVLHFLGRKDDQVKIRGQRVELGEIEYHVKECLTADLPGVAVVVEIIQPAQSDTKIPVALLALGSTAQDKELLAQVMADINTKLSDRMPGYMIPAVYVPLESFPMTATGKTDRKQLREKTSVMTLEQLTALSPARSQTGTRTAPSSTVEVALQRLWAEVLGVDPESIAVEDSFLRIGGDSVAAMRLVGSARRRGFLLTVADIFSSPCLKDLAHKMTTGTSVQIKPIKPFSLINTDDSLQSICKEVAELCHLTPDQIQDVFPCTPLQEGLLAMTAKKSGEYVARNILQLDDNLDLPRFVEAWNKVVASNDILRTRIVDLPNHGLMQVVVRSGELHTVQQSLDDYTQREKAQEMGLGAPLNRAAVVVDKGGRHLVWAIHHALYDGWSMPLLLQQLGEAYFAKRTPFSTPFQGFIKYVAETDPNATKLYWEKELSSCEASPFPALPSPLYQPQSNQVSHHIIQDLSWPQTDITQSTLLRAAWAIVISRQTSAEDVVFGIVSSGRQAKVLGIEQMTGPTIATVPVRAKLQSATLISDLLVSMQSQGLATVPYEQFGLSNIRKLGPGAEQACQFNSLLIVQPKVTQVQSDYLKLFSPDHLKEAESLGNDNEQFETYGLSIVGQLQDQGIKLEFRYDATLIPPSQADLLIRQLDQVLHQLCQPELFNASVGDITTIGQHDLSQIWEWNSKVPETVEACVHDLIAARVKRQPEEQAVCAWDGELTYAELDHVSNRLAHHLVSLGVTPGTIVPLCFEKSMWTSVAMLAVMKAGAASVALDTTQPAARLKSIVDQVFAHSRTNVILSSVANKELAGQCANITTTNIPVVVAAEIAKLSTKDEDFAQVTPLTPVTPKDLLYVVFTSGSTGVPKGATVTHENFCSAARHQHADLGLNAQSRVFDYVSYAFDVAWSNVLHTFIVGGCLCVPSDADRMDSIADSIKHLRANFAHITPTVAQLFSAKNVPGLKTIAFIGEKLSRSVASSWETVDVVLNTYGPAECTVTATIQPLKKSGDGSDPAIGKASGAVVWVVQPDGKGLVSIGEIGELWIEGPLVGNGYLGDSVKTAAAFVENPAWLARGGPNTPGRQGRLYRTGDLVRYDADGVLHFLGRKDDQVKIRGQRVELGEIEHHIKECFSDYPEVGIVVEIIQPAQSETKLPVAMLSLGTPVDKTQLLTEMMTDIDVKLSDRMPTYMIPGAFIPLESFPVTGTGKTDRKKLREMASAMTLEQLDALNPGSSRSSRRAPETEAELRLQRLWAEVFSVSPDSIFAEDSFLRIGGDSVAAMRLVGRARKEGLSLTVMDVFRSPRLQDMAKVAGTHLVSPVQPIKPFSLLKVDSVQLVCEQAATLCDLTPDQIQDAFPCTPLQEGLLAMTAKKADEYVYRNVLRLQGNIDPQRLADAWSQVVASTDMLRTRIVDLPNQGLVQVVTRTGELCSVKKSLNDYVAFDKTQEIKLGSSLNRAAVIADSTNKAHYLVWTMHHALYDAWSIPLYLEQIERVYYGNSPVAPTPFQRFIQYVTDLNPKSTKQYWEGQLTGCEAVPFPALPSPLYQPQATQLLHYPIESINWPQTDITPSSLLRSAWAIVISRQTTSEDVAFGIVSNGRQALVPGIERIAGPTIATVPVRVKIPNGTPVADLLSEMQLQALEMVPHEQYRLSDIQKLGPGAKQACEFQSLLIVEAKTQNTANKNSALFSQDELSDMADLENEIGQFETYGLTVQCQVKESGVDVGFSFDAELLAPTVANLLLRQFDMVLRQLCQPVPNMLVKEIQTTSEDDLRQIWSWNSTVPETVEACIQDLFAKQVKESPEAPAICAWDGELTYGELDTMSTRLAHHLAGLGAGPGTIIPLCFEKSMWTSVAMLGVMKAGAASVIMDASQPAARLRTIVEQAFSHSKRQIILSSVASRDVARELTSAPSIPVVVVAEIATQEPTKPLSPLAKTTPQDLLYVVFTSGSTGVPKGAMITHTNFSSVVQHQKDALGFNRESRVFDYASYAFDVAWYNVLLTLTTGGCLCVPSAADRMYAVAESMNRLGATYAELTPTLAQLISPQNVPRLRTVVFGGEKLDMAVASSWGSVGRAFNTYGPAECTVTSTVSRIQAPYSEDPDIGLGSGAVVWVVQLDGSGLVSIGEIGELWIEGPLVGVGYLGDAEKTAAAFIEDPAWLVRGGPGSKLPGRRGRLYRTGDLVRYGVDGKVYFVGRKDDQVKIRGQRVELGEIEHHLKECLTDLNNVSVVVEVVQPRKTDMKVLVAVLTLGDAAQDPATLKTMADIDTTLADRLPPHMIPNAYVHMDQIPISATGKTDRKRLRTELGNMSLEELAAVNLARLKEATRTAPTTKTELHLQKLWAEILGIEPDSIAAEDSFLRIGGESVAAMRLVGRAREQGLRLTVADIFRSPRLKDLALTTTTGDSVVKPVSPFSLLRAKQPAQNICAQAAGYCQVSADQIQDVFPCTSLQEGLLAMTVKQAGEYVARDVFRLHDKVQIHPLVEAWDKVTAANDILRTRIVDMPDQGLVQVVLRTAPPCTVQQGLDNYMAADKAQNIGLGEPLNRIAIVVDEKSNARYLVWTIHHALYDGWSMPLLLDQLEQAYLGNLLSVPPPFQGFIQYIVGSNPQSLKEYWQQQLGDCEAAAFPGLPTPVYEPQADENLRYPITGLQWPQTNITPSTLLRAAWALVLSRQTGSKDVVFGIVSNGRQAPVPGIEHMTGPTIATVPIRTRLQQGLLVKDLLSDMQRQALDMIPYEQFGLSNIRKLGLGAQQACQFQSLLVVQPTSEGNPADEHPLLFAHEETSEDSQQQQQQNVGQFETYGLTILCEVNDKGANIALNFDSKLIAPNKALVLLEQWEMVLRQLSMSESLNTPVSEIETTSIQNLRQIWAWNSVVPEPVEGLVHELFSQRAKQQPDAPALCAWDGEMTYGQLDALSTRLAHYLAGLGVCPGTIIPLYFEKSMWTPVAILGAMKAGAASVIMDASLPIARLRTIVQQVFSGSKRQLIVCSTANRTSADNLVSGLGDNIPVVVAAEVVTDRQQDDVKQLPLPQATPQDPLYVAFTSGSTGVPKGAIVTHANFASAVRHHQAELGFHGKSRVFDYVSYAFDVAWSNILHALTVGGCLCVPSDQERLDSIAGAIKRYGVNFAHITPTVSQLISPQDVPSLRTIVLGGEKLSRSVTSVWSHLDKVINVYGPAECTCNTALWQVRPADENDPGIGLGCGALNWVVHPDGNGLASIGEIGELWIEGPQVGMGYLNDAAKTANAFVENPPWLLRGGPDHPGRKGRLYRTGDLVRQDAEGVLHFVGRKDDQVKIRGQRVELGEIEYQVKEALPDSHSPKVVAEIIVPSVGHQAIVVVFISLGGQWDEAAGAADHATIVETMTKDLTEKLLLRIPAYMIPSLYIPIPNMPMTATGKIDRKTLRQSAMDLDLTTALKPTEGIRKAPTTQLESVLASVWAEVLNIPLDDISTNVTFLRLGGDSISAMQVVSRCRSRGVRFLVGDILRYQTIEKIAPYGQQIQVDVADSVDTENDGQPWDLSPVQQLFFANHPDGLNTYNQSFLLRLNVTITPAELRKIALTLVRRHPMLRARFQRNTTAGKWEQHTAEMSEDVFSFTEHPTTQMADVASLAEQRQNLLDITQGPVFAIDHIPTQDGTVLILFSAHHLVIDLVSWRIIWQDMEQLWRKQQQQQLSPPTTSFRKWCRLLGQEFGNIDPAQTLPFELDSGFEYWGVAPSDNVVAAAQDYEVWIDRETTSLLLDENIRFLRMEPVEIMMAVLLYSLKTTFSDRPAPAIWLENHGRTPLTCADTDLSETVGWFTTMYPLQVPLQKDSSLLDAVKLVRDTHSRIPSKGLPYFASHAGGVSPHYKDFQEAEFLFNYGGIYQQLETEESMFSRVAADYADISPSARRSALVEINGQIEQGRLHLTVSAHRQMKQLDLVQTWAANLGEQFRTALAAFADQPATLSLSDVPLLKTTYRDLDLIMYKLQGMGIEANNVATIFPCTPLQQGILLSINRGLATYKIVNIWRCERSAGIDAATLERAWKHAIARHSIFSTVFVESGGSLGFLQVQLRNAPMQVKRLQCDANPEEFLRELPGLTYANGKPALAVTIGEARDGTVACRLDISHAIFDAAASPILLGDVAKAYGNDQPSQSAPEFSLVVEQIVQRSSEASFDYWCKYLDGVEPCIVESPQAASPGDEATSLEVSIPAHVTAGIHDFCQMHDITRSSFLQVAWAMVLAHLTGKRDVCFGYLSSGRDMAINGIDEIIGPLINLLIARIQLDAPATDLLSTTMQHTTDHFDFQHISLAELQHRLGLRGGFLFNTAVTVRQAQGSEDTDLYGIRFDEVHGEDPNEFDIVLGVELDKSITDITMAFRSDKVDAGLVSDVVNTLTLAIRQLLDAGAQTDKKPLYDSFFESLTGVSEAEAKSTWKSLLQGIDTLQFPTLSGPRSTLPAQEQIHYEIPDVGLPGNPADLHAVLWTAWAVVISRKTNMPDVVFGSCTADQPRGNNTPNLMPVRIELGDEVTVDKALKQTMATYQKLEKVQRVGLDWVRRLGEDGERACNFQSSLEVQIHKDNVNGCGDQLPEGVDRLALQVKADVRQDETLFTFDFDPQVIDDVSVRGISQQLEQVIRQLCQPEFADMPVDEIETTSRQDLRQIWTWNAEFPEKVEACPHDLFVRRAKLQPDAQAICSWDGEMTYAELDAQSTRLAHYLVGLGAGPGTIVPLCFEKSIWTSVAMLGVMKTGAASAAMDTTQPVSRLSTITKECLSNSTQKIVLSSVTNRKLAEELVSGVSKRVSVVVPAEVATQSQANGAASVPLPRSSPEDLLCCVFTSGSTGVPKGAMLTHASMSSAIKHQLALPMIDGNSRVLDFASYAFDACWYNLLCAVTLGGTLCIPSQEDRMTDLSGTISRFKASCLILPPTAGRLLVKSDFDHLNTIVFGGELLLASDVSIWGNAANAFNVYGPSECTVISTIQRLDAAVTSNPGIGRGYGTVPWIVQPNGKGLVGVGETGELWLEGPLVGKGYLGNPQKTAETFIEDPAWLLRGGPDSPGRRGRLYRTGDLVRYDAEGVLHFVGRKDDQVKIRGQRVELGEIEHHMKDCLAAFPDVGVVVEAIQPIGSKGKVLIAVFSLGPAAKDGVVFEQIMTEIDNNLGQKLPTHMIPGAYIPWETLPMTATGKTDRKQLREIIMAMTLEEVTAYNQARLQTGNRTKPSSKAELQLQSLWADILGISADSIAAEDSFLRIGGDSVAAMRLVGQAREQGLLFSVTDVFRSPCLKDLAQIITTGSSKIEAIRPFSLLQVDQPLQVIQEQIAALCNLPADQIQDVFPCTPLQEGLLALTVKQSDEYVYRNVFRLRDNIDTQGLVEAWDKLMEGNDILRTRIVDLPDGDQGLVQVVTRTAPLPTIRQKLSTYMEMDRSQEIGLGSLLNRAAVVIDETDRARYLVWTIHHALYDGWSMPVFLEQMEQAYFDKATPTSTPFQGFIKYIVGTSPQLTKQFWETQLADCEAAPFPPLPSPMHQPQANQHVYHQIADFTWPKSNITPSTLLRAAWAVVISRQTASEDVAFGIVSNGRQAQVPGIESMTGPTIATVPVRAKLQRDTAVADVLSAIQRQALEIVPYEQFGLSNIRKLGPGAEQACQFQSLLVVQPKGDASTDAGSRLFCQEANDEADQQSNIGQFETYGLTILCELTHDGVDVGFSFDSKVVTPNLANLLFKQFDMVLRQLCNPEMSATPVGEIETTSNQDLRQIWTWNRVIPETIETCVHTLFGLRARQFPTKQAICAWDGEFTYTELDDLSTRLAHKLAALGAGPGTIIPLCFEKSRWTSVAMIAVMKSGAASVAMDTTQPLARSQSIVTQAFANSKRHLIVSSVSNRALADQLADGVPVVVAPEVVKESQDLSTLPPLPQASPHDLLYVVFTSGSTGVPKGAMVTHANFCSAMTHQEESLCLGSDTRILDFASYAFDASWYSFLSPITTGGTCCVPSQEDRLTNLSGAISSTAANYISVPPSAARVFSDADFNYIKTIVLGGEMLLASDADVLKKAVNVMNVYGPAECTVISTVQKVDRLNPGNPGIGRGSGTVPWVVQPDGKSLVSIGEIGELWIEGPLVGNGYLGDPVKTAAAFVEDPAWLLRGGPDADSPGRHGRLYRTGDLVRYDSEGVLHFVGRKDDQVKIRGQRVELGEIEHHVKQYFAPFPMVLGVVVEVVQPAGSKTKLPVAILNLGTTAKDDPAIAQMMANADSQLRDRLPTHMIPGAYIPMQSFPVTATGKTDRKRLREMSAAMTLDQLDELNLARTQDDIRTAPSTEVELQLQRLWAGVLGINPDTIAAEDSFLRIGGDSITAMRLVGRAREQGLRLTVTDIFRSPRLCDLAIVAKAMRPARSAYVEPSPFSLVTASSALDQYLPALQAQGATVVDLLPTTDFQKDCIQTALSTPLGRAYHFYLDFPLSVDPQRIVELCHLMWQQFDILRAVFVQDGDSYLQAIIDRIPLDISVHQDDDPVEASRQWCTNDFQILKLGKSFIRAFLCSSPVAGSRLVLRLSHAQYDGLALAQLVEFFSAGLQGQAPAPKVSFAGYMHQIHTQQSSSIRYWQELLQGSSITQIPTHPTHPGKTAQTLPIEKYEIANPPKTTGTAASVFVTTCALAISKLTGEREVVFGLQVSGRATLPGVLSDVVGPCINTIPVRIDTGAHASIDDLVAFVQEQMATSMNYELCQLSSINASMGWKKSANYGFMVQFQNIDEELGVPTAGGHVELKELDVGPHESPSDQRLIVIYAKPKKETWDLEIIGRLGDNEVTASLKDGIREAISAQREGRFP